MNSPTIQVYPDAAALTTAAAEQFAAIAQTAVANHGRFVVALSGGSTPRALFALLASASYAAALPWANMHFFWGDERLVPPDDPGSSFFLAHTLLFSHVPVPAGNIHRARGEWEPATAAAEYAQQLRRFGSPERPWPRFDLVLLGLGSDGHTASLFPGPIPATETTQPVIAVTAQYEDRPAHRLTLTPPVFNAARQIMFLVTGAQKAVAVAATINGKPNRQQWPAQRIRPSDGQLTWLLDAAAAAQLP